MALLRVDHVAQVWFGVHSEDLVTEEPLHSHQVDLGLAQILLNTLDLVNIYPDLELGISVPGPRSLHREGARTLPQYTHVHDLLAGDAAWIDDQQALRRHNSVVSPAFECHLHTFVRCQHSRACFEALLELLGIYLSGIVAKPTEEA
jgi:hypothetical protein